jgi:hypothetical protein
MCRSMENKALGFQLCKRSSDCHLCFSDIADIFLSSSNIFSFSKLFYSKVHHDVSQMSLDALKCVYSFAQVRLLVVKHHLA